MSSSYPTQLSPSPTSESSASDLLKEARNLLSSLSKSGDRLRLSQRDVPGQKGEETLRCCLTLAKSLHNTIALGLGPFPDSGDWIVVKSVFELVVRWGIYPNLSEGVGIPLQKRFKHGAAVAATAALRTHATENSVANPSLYEHAEESCSFFCISEFLASIILSNSSGALRLLLLTSHLPDIFAAYFQLCYGPLPSVYSQEQISEWRKLSSNTIIAISNCLPVSHKVEALLILLHQRNPEPPPWLKSAAGRLLSSAVMQDGGVAAVLERLVGGAEARGNSKMYADVADHLARSPQSVASADDYFRKICPQLQPLLLLHLQHGTSLEGESALTARDNMQRTAVMIACSMAKNDSGLLNAYLLEPLLEPLMSWEKLQSTAKDRRSSDLKVASLTEKKLVECFLQVHVLLTAGHRGANLVRQLLFHRTRSCAPLLLKLHYLLQASSTTAGAGKEGLSVGDRSNSKEEGQVTGTGSLTRGMPQHLKARERERTSSDSSSIQEELRVFEVFRNAIAEFVTAYIVQPVEHSLPVVWTLEEDNHYLHLDWPTSVGEIASALDRSRRQPLSVAMFLSKLILIAENWSLALSVVSKLILKLAQLRKDVQAWMESPGSRSTKAASQSKEMLCVAHFLETVVEEVGAKAIEEDTAAAVLFVKDLTNDASISGDEYSAKLVVYIVHRLMCKLGEGNCAGKHLGRKAPSLSKKELYETLLSSVEKLLLSNEASNEVKAMSNSLQNLIVEALYRCR